MCNVPKNERLEKQSPIQVKLKTKSLLMSLETLKINF